MIPFDLWLKKERELYESKTPTSKKIHLRAKELMPHGISSCYQSSLIYPMCPKFGRGSNIIDVDENAYVDFHCGFGVNIMGYSHPEIIKQMNRVHEQGNFISLTSEATIEAAEKLQHTYGDMYSFRFMNSGTEATLDAVRLARAHTDRKYIIKIESGYHGHHDSVWISIDDGARLGSNIPSTPFCQGIPREVADLTLIAEFNNIKSVEKIFLKFPLAIAAVIVEPVMLNTSMILPGPSFLKDLRHLCTENGAILIYDLVKLNTGCHPDTCFEKSKIQESKIQESKIQKFKIAHFPDIICLGKSLTSGMCPIGALGICKPLKETIENHRVNLAGTYNGNSIAMNAINLVLSLVTEDVQRKMENTMTNMTIKMKKILTQHSVLALISNIGNKGCIVFKKSIDKEMNDKEINDKITNYQDYVKYKSNYLEEIFPLFMMNRGIWIQQRDEWSLSIVHTDQDVEKFISLFEEFILHLVQLRASR